jgi:general secretion pathway protein L
MDPDSVPHEGPLAQAALACKDAMVVALVPGLDVLLIKATIPGRNHKRAMQAAPYALEASLAADVEKLHFAFGPRNPDGSMDTAVVERECMDRWLALLGEVGLDPDYMTPETLAVPHEAEGVAVVLDGDVALVRSGLRAGFAVDRQNLNQALQAVVPDGSDSLPPHLQIYQEEEVPISLDLDLDMLPITKKPALTLLGQGFDLKSAINLRQGEYGRNTDWDKIRELWRVPFVLALLLIVLKGALFGVDFHQARKESRALERRIEEIYRTTFPQAKQLVNPKAQMEQGLALLTGGQQPQDSFLSLLARVGPELQEKEGRTLQRLRYHGSVLELELTLTTLDDLNDLKERLLDTDDLSVGIRTATTANDLVSARLEIKGEK